MSALVYSVHCAESGTELTQEKPYSQDPSHTAPHNLVQDPFFIFFSLFFVFLFVRGQKVCIAYRIFCFSPLARKKVQQ